MKKKVFKLFFMLLLGLTFSAQAQKKIITGIVSDAAGESLPGATVNIKGTFAGTSVDVDGAYSINVDEGDFLVFSHIGYTTQEVKVGAQSNIDISLSEDIAFLGEVVVIGYGNVKKEDLTGSVSVISAKDFNQGPVTSIDNLIQGRAAGVQISAANSEPGGDFLVRIRGNNSINSNNSPLYVVDGFPLQNLDNSISPSDIKSISILKDASATAIYGTRGANGVIIITTKRGTDGKAIISLSSETSFNYSDIEAYDFLDAKEYADIQNNLNVLGNLPPAYDEASLTRIQELGLDTDWLNEAFRSGKTSRHEVSVTGGDKDTKVFISGELYKLEGTVKNTSFDRYSVRMNLDQNLLDGKLRLGTNTSITATETNFQGFSASSLQDNILRGIFRASPIIPPSDQYNDLSEVDRQLLFNGNRPINPIETLFISENESNKFFVLSNAFLEFQIANSLIFKTTAGARISNTKIRRFLPSTSRLVASTIEPGAAIISHGLLKNYIVENTLSFNKEVKKHSIQAVVGATNEWRDPQNFSAGAKGFTTDGLGFNALQAGATPLQPTSGGIASKLASYLGRVNYTYNDKYLLTLTVRRDGSSKFGKGNKWGNFPAAALAWKIRNENFLKDNTTISTLKLRSSYGIIGNERFNPGLGKSTFAANAPTTVNGTDLLVGTISANIGNSDLKWEETATLDVGLELGLFDDRLFVEVGAYKKKTTDLLLDKLVAPSLGVAGGSILVNAGETENKGVELAINSRNIITDDFSWTSNFNVSYNENKIVDIVLPEGGTFLPGPRVQIDGGIAGSYTVIQEGLPVNAIYGYKFLGILQEGEIAPEHQPALTPGQAKFEDINNDGVFDTTDKEILGNGFPKYSFGITNSFRYKNFNLSLFFSGLLDVDKINGNNLVGYKDNTLELAKERWSTNNQEGTLPLRNWIGDQWVNDYNVENGAFVRLKNVSLSYNLDTEKLKLGWLSSLQIYMTASNLITWDSYSGFDPEANSRANQNANLNTAAGLDTYSYPVSRNFSLGLKVGI